MSSDIRATIYTKNGSSVFGKGTIVEVAYIVIYWCVLGGSGKAIKSFPIRNASDDSGSGVSAWPRIKTRFNLC